MAAVSYFVAPNGTLEAVTIGTNAPSAAGVEIRIDQTTTTVTDNGSTRALKRGEALRDLITLLQAIERDTSLNQ